MKIDIQDKLPLKEQVKEFVKERIATGAYAVGGQMPTQRALATELGLGNRTVEMALKELEIEGLLLRRVGLGTFVKGVPVGERPVCGQSNIIAVFVPNIENPLFAQFSSVAEAVLLKNGKNMLLCRSEILRVEEEKYIRQLVDRRVDGVIIYGRLPKLEALLRKNGTPIINVSDVYSGEGIFLDLYHAGELAAEYLISMGHREIVCAGSFPSGSVYGHDRRFDGVLDAMAKHGLSVEDAVVPQLKRNQLDYAVIGAEVTEKILKRKKRPTAIIYYNDARAFGALQYFYSKGLRIPDDISVMSFDNVSFCALSTPALTSVDLDMERAAVVAVENILSGNMAPVKLNTRVIARGSVRDLSR